MATIIKNEKNGKIISYKFRTYLGRDKNGKQLAQYTTWIVPNELTPTKAERAANKAAAEWEKAVKAEYEKDLSRERLFQYDAVWSVIYMAEKDLGKAWEHIKRNAQRAGSQRDANSYKRSIRIFQSMAPAYKKQAEVLIRTLGE